MKAKLSCIHQWSETGYSSMSCCQSGQGLHLLEAYLKVCCWKKSFLWDFQRFLVSARKEIMEKVLLILFWYFWSLKKGGRTMVCVENKLTKVLVALSDESVSFHVLVVILNHVFVDQRIHKRWKISGLSSQRWSCSSFFPFLSLSSCTQMLQLCVPEHVCVCTNTTA